MITVQELNEIEMRWKLSQNGPWRSFIEDRDHESGSHFIMTGQGSERGEDIELTGATIYDYDFIAHAKQDIPRLIDEIRRLKQQLELE